ncbi:MAG: ABC transporter substrate-binding protein [Planctomycetota bacterium]
MKTDLVNAAGLLTAVLLAGWLALIGRNSVQVNALVAAAAEPNRAGQVVDAEGTAVVVRPYARIVSLNPVADHLLLQLVEPARLIAVSSLTLGDHPEAWRFGDSIGVDRKESIESVIALRPDLVVSSPFVDASRHARLRELGIAVFNLGEMRGVGTTREGIEDLGRLLGLHERAARLQRKFDRDLAALAASATADEPRGIYLSVYGDTFFGGTAGTSYGDVLGLAGFRDAAAESGFIDWPQYTSEALIELAPDWIVTRKGMGEVIRRHPVLAQLPAVRSAHRILEIDDAYDGDAGLGVVHAADSLQHALRQASEFESSEDTETPSITR